MAYTTNRMERWRLVIDSLAAVPQKSDPQKLELVNYYYGYIASLLVTKQVTWLECAAASLFWSTILVYYLEKPYGHLMLEGMEGAQARTEFRGNLFSFAMPWEDIEKCCAAAMANTPSLQRAELEQIRDKLRLPHGEEVLASLLNVHIV